MRFAGTYSSEKLSRSRQSSIASGSTGSLAGLMRGRSQDSRQLVAVYLIPLKDVRGKVGLFVFVLATGA